MVQIYFLLSFLFLSVAYAQVDLGAGLKISQSQIDKIWKQLPRLEEDKHFVHWTTEQNAMRWVTQGHINAGEMEYLNLPTGNSQNYGPGLYLATDPTSSRSYGPAPVSVTIRKGTPIYDKNITESVIGVPLTDLQASKLGESIPMIRKINEDWLLTNHPKNTTTVEYAKKYHPSIGTYSTNRKEWTQLTNPQVFKDLVRMGDGDAIYLKNLIDASNYMDGLSFARAMKVNPGAPWQEVDAQAFQRYQKGLESLSEKGATAIKDEGAAKAILMVNNAFTGKRATSFEQLVRDEGMRSGGSEANKTFLATTKQLEAMKANPYLEVHATKAAGDLQLVHYFYPDAFHYKKLKDKISPELFKTLSQQTTEGLMQNHDLRRSLNRRLMNELLDDFIKRKTEGTATWSELLSFQPFRESSPSTIRILREVYEGNDNHNLINDLDVLLSSEEQQLYRTMGGKSHAQFRADLVDEFLMAKTQKRMPDYMRTGALKTYVNNGLATPFKIDLSDQTTLEQIRNRQWPLLMERGEKEGMKEFLKNVSTESKHEALVPALLDYTQNGTTTLYSQEEKKALMNALLSVITDPKPEVLGVSFDTMMGQGLPSYQNYREYYKSLDDVAKKGLIEPFELVFKVLADPETRPKGVGILLDETTKGPKNFTPSRQEKIAKTLIELINDPKTNEDKIVSIYEGYVHFYNQADPEVIGKLKSPFDEFLAVTKNPSLKVRAQSLLATISDKSIFEALTPDKQKVILNFLSDSVGEQEMKLTTKYALYLNYEKAYAVAKPELVRDLTKPMKLELQVMKFIKDSLKNPQLDLNDLYLTLFNLSGLDRDSVRGLNYQLSFLSKDLPPKTFETIVNGLESNIEMYKDLMFNMLEPPDQRRMLLTVKAYIERMIDYEDKKKALKGVETYREYYEKSTAEVRAKMPRPEDLRTWTKKGGHGVCTLLELISKL